MDKIQAQEFISNVLQSKFDPEQYTLLVRNLLNNFEHRENNYQGGSLWESYREHISNYRRIGKYTDPNGDAMDILIVEVKSLSKLDRARTSLRNFVVKHLQTFEKDYAIAAFYSKEDGGKDWRFSFVKIEIESERTAEGKIKARKELTPAKRYSFLVGAYENSYTAQKQLLPLLLNDYSNPTIEEIENTFSIEKVTDEFFEQYKELYLKLSENNDLSEILVKAGLEPIRFTKKLLGQIVFLYFLQKKGWLGVPKNETWGKGDKKYMQNLFNEALKNGKNYYRDYLQYLFYEALAKDRRDTADPVYYRRFDCKIPFLNGGLFEADYDWEKSNIVIPNNLIRNEEKNKAGDKGTGIFDVFDRYNFTIKEDEPLEKEVAVDPEMLGKVFENMLEIKERKSKGAYYTPREIVHYMCQESLINYIDTAINDYSATYQAVNTDQLNIFGGSHNKKGQMSLEIEHKIIRVSKEDIELFIRKGYLAVENDIQVLSKGKETDRYKFQLPESIQVNADLIDEKLTSIKICDPAIGSGAFPVGLLHELVIAQKVLLPFLSNKYLVKKLETIELIKEEYKQDPERYIYKIKRHTIQESIYGVDIDPSAIDIARLRLWLSLIVDETDFYNIEALPNLDYKIVNGESLIGFPKNWKSNISDEIDDLKRQYFSETETNKKHDLKLIIDKKISERYSNSEETFGYPVKFDFKTHFSEVWHYKNGFDIIIANPPFVSAWEMTKNNNDYRSIVKKALNDYKDELQGHWDLYIAFIVLANKLLNDKGSFIFILPNPVLREKYAMPIRRFILNKMYLKSILHFDESNVFKKVSRKAAILHVGQFCNLSDTKIFRNSIWGNGNRIFLDRTVNRSQFIANEGLRFTIDVSDDEFKLLKNIETSSYKLGSMYYINYGAQISSKISGKFKKQDVISKEPTGNAKKFIEGKDIGRWKLVYRGLWLDYRKDEMYGPRSESLFDSTKILIRKVSDKNHKIAATIDYEKYYTDDGIVIATNYSNLPDVQQAFDGIERIECKLSIEYIYSQLINSITDYYFKAKYATESLQGSTSHTYPKTVRQLPIFQNPNDTEFIIKSIVRYIYFLKDEFILMKKYFIEILDAIQFDLYFHDALISANKEIIKYIGSIRPINENMSKEEMHAIVLSEFNRLYDPNHPVRNNLETLDSVEEVRIIKEALK